MHQDNLYGQHLTWCNADLPWVKIALKSAKRSGSLVGVGEKCFERIWDRHLRVFTGFHRFYVKKCRKTSAEGIFQMTVKSVKIDYFQCQPIYSDLEFDEDSDFFHHTLSEIMSWKRTLKVPENAILHIVMAVNPIKIVYFFH